MAKARAVVQVGDRRYEIQEFELPRVRDDDALMRVEACGICGSDVDQYDGKLNGIGLQLPIVPGHEPVGVIEEIGAEAARHGVSRRATGSRSSRGWDAAIAATASRGISGDAASDGRARRSLPAVSYRPIYRPRCGEEWPSTCTSIRTPRCTRSRAISRPNSPRSTNRWRRELAGHTTNRIRAWVTRACYGAQVSAGSHA